MVIFQIELSRIQVNPMTKSLLNFVYDEAYKDNLNTMHTK